jgi:hypothetical protein
MREHRADARQATLEPHPDIKQEPPPSLSAAQDRLIADSPATLPRHLSFHAGIRIFSGNRSDDFVAGAVAAGVFSVPSGEATRTGWVVPIPAPPDRHSPTRRPVRAMTGSARSSRGHALPDHKRNRLRVRPLMAPASSPTISVLRHKERNPQFQRCWCCQRPARSSFMARTLLRYY